MRHLGPHRTAALPQLAVLAIAILALAGPADAQVLYGSIVGNVTDTSQASVPGATVTAIQIQTNLARETTTTGTGGYAFANLPEGTYTVRITLHGFKESIQEQVPVSPNTVSRIDVVLEVGALAETITVQTARTLLQTDTGDLHSVIDSEEIGKLPLGSYRSYQTLLNLVPGTTPGRSANALTDTPAGSLTNNFNGVAKNNNNTRLDGATNIFIWLPHNAVYVAPAETVDTVNVATASFDAEQGMAGGVAISVMTKSGTNEFHGSGTYLFENQGLRARNYFNDGDKPDSHRKIGAVTLGGPIIKDKLFFFGGWEGHFQEGAVTKTGTLPTADQRLGDCSAYDTVIYDPMTGNPDGTGRTPFPGNVIPADRIDPTSAQIQSRIPMPNAAGLSGNYSDTGPFNLDRNNYDLKVNWNISNSMMLWGKYSRMNAIVSEDMWLGNPQDGGIGGRGWAILGGVGTTSVDLWTIGFTWTVAPTLVVDAVIAGTNMEQEIIPNDFGTNWGLTVLGIPGTNGAGCCEDDIRYTGMPAWNIAGYEPLGGVDGWTPLFRNDDTYNGSLNATWIKGVHEFRAGFDVVRLKLNHWQPELGNPRGSFNFGGGATALAPSGSPNQLNAYAQFLLGLSTTTNKSIQYELMTGREWQYGLYVRDRWPVNRNLTLTLGLRYEYYPIMKRADRGIESYDPATNLVTLCGRGGTPDDCGFENDHPKLLPRVGFAYRLGEDNVFRGGFGRTVSPIPVSRPLRGFYPLTIANTFVSANSVVPVSDFSSGIPVFFGPPRDQAQVELPPTALFGSPVDKLTRGYVDAWNLIYERRLPWDMSVSAGYVGTKTVDQRGFWNYNASSVGQGRAGQPLFAPWGRTANTRQLDGWLGANYHSLQIALNKPFSRGFFLKGAYTWSKAMNRTDDEGWSNVNWNEPAYQFKNYAWAGHDRTQIFQLGFVWEMPIRPQRLGRPQRDRQRLVGQRSVGRFCRHAVPRALLRRFGQLAGERAVG